MLYRKATKNSYVVITDEESAIRAISETIQHLAGSYEMKVLEDHFLMAVEIYLGLNLSSIERATLIREVSETLDRALRGH